MGNSVTYPTVDLSGKVALVTGANTGIGYETAKALAEMGAHTFIACRSQEKAAAAVDRMKREVGEGKELKVEYLLVDLASFSSVKDFVKTFKEKNLPLHILVNNAAVAWTPFKQTEDGFESHLQVNHLSPLLLTLELLPVVLETASGSGNGRIVFMSSKAHEYATWNPETMNASDEQHYDRIKVYGVTKLYNVMTAIALQRRLQNVGITLSTVDPGVVRTDVVQGFQDMKAFSLVIKVVHAVRGKSPQEGAATSINCAVNPELNSQQACHYADCRETPSSTAARNEQFQEELWKRSFEFLKDHLSPETVEKYGPPPEPAETGETTTQGVVDGGEEATKADTAAAAVGDTTADGCNVARPLK